MKSNIEVQAEAMDKLRWKLNVWASALRVD